MQESDPNSNDFQEREERKKRNEASKYALFMAEVILEAHELIGSFKIGTGAAVYQLEEMSDSITNALNEEVRNDSEMGRVIDDFCLVLGSQFMGDFEPEMYQRGRELYLYEEMDLAEGKVYEYDNKDEQECRDYYARFEERVAELFEVEPGQISDYRNMLLDEFSTAYEVYYNRN